MSKKYVKKEYNGTRNYVKDSARAIAREVGSVGILTAAGAIAFSQIPELLRDVKDTVQYGRHAVKTTGEIVYGGPEGERAVRSLEDSLQKQREQYNTALRTVEEETNSYLVDMEKSVNGMKLDSAMEIVGGVSRENQEAREALDGYFDERVKYVEKLSEKYSENETLAREAERLVIHLEGLLVKGTSAVERGKEATGWRKIDDWIMKVTGKKPEEVRGEFDKLNKVYERVLEFYDSREKNENTIAETTNYLRKEVDRSIEENKKLNEDLDLLIGQLDRTYEVEDHVFDLTDKVGFFKNLVSFKKAELIKERDMEITDGEIGNYRVEVDSVRETVSEDVPMPEFVGGKWIDYVVNPVTLGLTAALGAKMVSKFMLPRRAYDAVTSLTLAPVVVPYKMVKGCVNGIRKIGKRKNVKLKNPEVEE